MVGIDAQLHKLLHQLPMETAAYKCQKMELQVPIKVMALTAYFFGAHKLNSEHTQPPTYPQQRQQLPE